MKRNFLFAVALSLLAVAGVSAQKAANFSGHWELDPAKSKLGDRVRIESMTMDVAQTVKDVKVDTKTARAPRPDAPTTNPTGAGGGMGRGFGGGGDSSFTYTLDGNETTVQQEGPMGPTPVKLTAKIEGGKLNLSSARTFSGPNGDISITSKETWTLSPDGKTLTVSRESTNPRGTTTMEYVFVKK